MIQVVTELGIADGKRLGRSTPLMLGRGITRCDAHAPAAAGGRFVCTREAGHTGPHMAHANQYEIAATWAR